MGQPSNKYYPVILEQLLSMDHQPQEELFLLLIQGLNTQLYIAAIALINDLDRIRLYFNIASILKFSQSSRPAKQTPRIFFNKVVFKNLQ